MDYKTINTEVCLCISEFTDIPADVRFREGSSSIMISWQGEIPSEDATSKIEEALKQFGTVMPNHARSFNFVSFMILR